MSCLKELEGVETVEVKLTNGKVLVVHAEGVERTVAQSATAERMKADGIAG